MTKVEAETLFQFKVDRKTCSGNQPEKMYNRDRFFHAHILS